jgi:hypothetical protein
VWFVSVFLATIFPLALRHTTDSSTLASRGLTGLAWSPEDSILVRIAKVGTRYAAHYAPDFLFFRGDRFPAHSFPGTGVFEPYVLPLILAGLAVVWLQSRNTPKAGSWAARILLAWLLLYPVGDLLKDHPSAHLLRSLPGLPVLALLGGLGIIRTLRFLRVRGRKAAGAGVALLLLAAFILDGRFLLGFFGSLNREDSRYHGNQVDLTEACRFVAPRLAELDAVFCTTRGFSFPYITTLVGLDYDPVRWQRDSKEYLTDGEWLICRRYGKISFLYERADYDAFRALLGNERRERVALIARPGELSLQQAGVTPHRILDPHGEAVLEVYLLDL